MNNYTAQELMMVRAARELKDGDVVFVGIGLPNLACNLARRTHSPNLVLIYESGAVGAVPERLPVSIGDPCLATGALSICGMGEIFNYYLQGGKIDVGFLQGAQIDRYGNINTTVIGYYQNPKVRLPGSGGACEIAVHAKKVVILSPQKKRNFPEKVDFITSPGFLNGGGKAARLKLGMPGAGPSVVITDQAVYQFDPESGEMILTCLYPGITLEQVQAELGWKIKVAENLSECPLPTPEELRIIREELDPEHIYIKV